MQSTTQYGHTLHLKHWYLIQIPNRELLHAVIALYNTSLSEMTPEVLYATVCERWSRSVILLRDVKGRCHY